MFVKASQDHSSPDNRGTVFPILADLLADGVQFLPELSFRVALRGPEARVHLSILCATILLVAALVSS